MTGYDILISTSFGFKSAIFDFEAIEIFDSNIELEDLKN